MILITEEGKIEIPIRIKKADRFLSRFLGFMFKKELPMDQGIWLIPCNSIHMFFMRFPIDVIFLDSNNQVVKIVENLQPRKILPKVKNAYSTLELPIGTIRKYNIKIGDQLIL